MADLIDRRTAIDAVLDRMNVEKYGRNAKPEEIQWTLEKMPSAQPEQRWIPCAARMPEEDNRMSAESRQYSDHVLMSVYNADDDEAFIDYGYTVDGNWQSDTTDCLVPPWWEVIAWMPLPEPYKEDDHETD